MVYLSSIGNHVLRASRLNVSSTLRLYSTGKKKSNIIIPDTTFVFFFLNPNSFFFVLYT